jgi:hypothetical protein
MTTEQRRLAAIVSADIPAYSRLMGRDESGTLARLREHRMPGASTRTLRRPAQAASVSRRVRCPGDHACRVNRASTSYLGALFCGLVP